MAVKKSENFKKVTDTINDYTERFLELLACFVEEEAKNIANWIKNVTHLKQKIRKAVVSLALLIGGITILLLGLGQYIAETMQLPHYLGYVMMGFIGIIVSMIYHKV